MTQPVLNFVVVGDPVEHSLSPRIHQAALDWNGISGRYTPRRVLDRAGMERVAADIREGALTGANVTMPHKQVAAAIADELTDTALRTSAVNTLYCADGRVVGETTDVAGIRWAWEEVGFDQAGPALILGAGGAAGAALIALEDRPLWISARRPIACRELLDTTGVDATIVEWGVGVDATVVNATPVGMGGAGSLPEPVLDAARGLFDMVYGDETPSVQTARAMGLPACDGSFMLVGQAAESFSIWTGVALPHRVMLDALRV